MANKQKQSSKKKPKNRKHIYILISILIIAVITGIILMTSKDNEENFFNVEGSYEPITQVFKPPYNLSDDISEMERIDTDGITAYFKPGRNKITKYYEYINKELVRTSGWAIWGLQADGLEAMRKYKVIINMAIDQMPEDPNTVIAKLNTHQMGIEGGHHVCITPNDNTLEIKASDFEDIETFKEITMEIEYKDFPVGEMEHVHKKDTWEEFNGIYTEGALELRVGWVDQKIGIKVKEIRIEEAV